LLRSNSQAPEGSSAPARFHLPPSPGENISQASAKPETDKLQKAVRPRPGFIIPCLQEKTSAKPVPSLQQPSRRKRFNPSQASSSPVARRKHQPSQCQTNPQQGSQATERSSHGQHMASHSETSRRPLPSQCVLIRAVADLPGRPGRIAHHLTLVQHHLIAVEYLHQTWSSVISSQKMPPLCLDQYDCPANWSSVISSQHGQTTGQSLNGTYMLDTDPVQPSHHSRRLTLGG
jgi:hypothetical protein